MQPHYKGGATAMWRLIVFIVIFAIFLLFIVLNLGNRCDISFGFIVFRDIPVFLTVFSSFMIGLLCTLPFALGFRSRKKAKVTEKPGNKEIAFIGKGKNTGIDTEDTSLLDKSHYGID